MYVLLHWTKLGRYIFAVGDNVNAAIASGVSVMRTKLYVYAISGFLAGVAGVIFTAKTASGQANIGVGYETDAIAACVLGGTSFSGGIATVPGVLIGIFIIGFMYNGMNLIGIDSYYQSMTKGAVIILAIILFVVVFVILLQGYHNTLIFFSQAIMGVLTKILQLKPYFMVIDVMVKKIGYIFFEKY